MRKKILIIEDDRFLGDVLLEKLKNENFDMTLARDGLEGFKKISEVKPDLILLDIILPSMNGYEILQKKWADPAIKDIPVIVISNSGQPVEISRVLQFGVKDYLVKAQFDPGEVLEKIHLLFGAAKTATAEKGDKGSLAGKRVLWVEDDKFLSDILSRKLLGEKCILFHAENGETALGYLQKEKFDVVLLDVILSGMDGYQILAKIKVNPDTRDIPVIMLSNLGQQSEIEKGKSLGAINFLIKATVTPAKIMNQIRFRCII